MRLKCHVLNLLEYVNVIDLTTLKDCVQYVIGQLMIKTIPKKINGNKLLIIKNTEKKYSHIINGAANFRKSGNIAADICAKDTSSQK